MQEVPAAEQKPADLPSLPKGNGGIINPAAIGTGGLVFIAEKESASKMPSTTNTGRPLSSAAGCQRCLCIPVPVASLTTFSPILTGVKALFAEIDRRKAAGQTIPPLVEALDADKAGRDNARNLQEAARARGVFIAEGVSVTGTNKDANDALRAEGAAFAERVKAATRDAEKSAAEQSTESGFAPLIARKRDNCSMSSEVSQSSPYCSMVSRSNSTAATL